MAAGSPPSVLGSFQIHMPLPARTRRSPLASVGGGRTEGSAASGTSTDGRHGGGAGGWGGGGGGGQPASAVTGLLAGGSGGAGTSTTGKAGAAVSGDAGATAAGWGVGRDRRCVAASTPAATTSMVPSATATPTSNLRPPILPPCSH